MEGEGSVIRGAQRVQRGTQHQVIDYSDWVPTRTENSNSELRAVQLNAGPAA